MAIISRIFGKFSARQSQRHEFSEAEQLKSQLSRDEKTIEKKQLELMKLRMDDQKRELDKLLAEQKMNLMQDRIDDLRDEMYGEDEAQEGDVGELASSFLAPEDMQLLNIFSTIFGKGQAQVSQPNTPSQESTPNLEAVPDSEVDSLVEKIPSFAKKQVKKILEPYSDDVVQRAILKVKNGK